MIATLGDLVLLERFEPSFARLDKSHIFIRLLHLVEQCLAFGSKVPKFSKNFPAKDIRGDRTLPWKFVALEALLHELQQFLLELISFLLFGSFQNLSLLQDFEPLTQLFVFSFLDGVTDILLADFLKSCAVDLDGRQSAFAVLWLSKALD